MTAPTLEVHLEELNQTGLLYQAATVLGGTSSFGPYRFVARAADDDAGEASTVAASATFLLLRFLDHDALTKLNASSDITQRLAELDRDLVADGWRQGEAQGPYWWSRTYQQAP